MSKPEPQQNPLPQTTSPHLGCPLLPDPATLMSGRCLSGMRDAQSAEACREFFVEAQRYANYLWTKGLPARAILALCRAIYLPEIPLHQYGLQQPFNALIWMYHHPQKDTFLGNPRLSFFHQATRMPRRWPLRRWRAWALWYLTCRALPELTPDPYESRTPYPSAERIAQALNEEGLEDEGTHWQDCLMAIPEQENLQVPRWTELSVRGSYSPPDGSAFRSL